MFDCSLYRVDASPTVKKLLFLCCAKRLGLFSVDAVAPAGSTYAVHSFPTALSSMYRAFLCASLQATAWEQSAALTENQLTAADLIAQACAHRPYPAHVRDAPEDSEAASSAAPAGPRGAEAPAGSSKATLEQPVLHNAAQFQKWYSELETTFSNRTEEKYRQYIDVLKSHLGSCEGLTEKVG